MINDPNEVHTAVNRIKIKNAKKKLGKIRGQLISNVSHLMTRIPIGK